MHQAHLFCLSVCLFVWFITEKNVHFVNFSHVHFQNGSVPYIILGAHFGLLFKVRCGKSQHHAFTAVGCKNNPEVQWRRPR